MGKSGFALGGVILLFISGIVGFLSLTAGGLFFSASNINDPVDQFFAKLKNENDSAARLYLEDQYSNSMDAASFTEFIDEYELRFITGTNWLQRSISKDSGELIGDLFRPEGQPFTARIQLVLSNGAWKIRDIEINGETAETQQIETVQSPTENESAIPEDIDPVNTESKLADSSEPVAEFTELENDVEPLVEDTIGVLTVNDIPRETEAKEIVQRWTTEFCKGVSQRNFSNVHAQFADEFRQKFSLAKFTTVFQEFIDRRLDLRWVQGIDPVLDRNPALTIDGVLELVGHYPAEPRVNFSYSFTKKADGWKPVSINLRIPTEAGGSGIPNDAELKQLVVDSTTRFGRAVETRDFGKFYKQTYSRFQQKFSIQQFRDYFGSFVENEIDLGWLNGINPIFDTPPSINVNGFLRLEGHFPADPKVVFKYSFIEESGIWKVSAINLSIPNEDELPTSDDTSNSDQ